MHSSVGDVGKIRSQPAMNEFADVPVRQGFQIATDVDADQPYAGSAANDLVRPAGQISSQEEKCGTCVAHTAAASHWFSGWTSEKVTDGGSAASFPVIHSKSVARNQCSRA